MRTSKFRQTPIADVPTRLARNRPRWGFRLMFDWARSRVTPEGLEP